MRNYNALAIQINELAKQYTFEDYTNGSPYYQIRPLCESYEEYQYGCNLLDEKAVQLGVDPLVVSEQHSIAERFFFRNEVNKERVGLPSRRLVVPMNNAADGKIINFPRTKDEPPLYITAPEYKIDNEKIYWRSPDTDSWLVISHTLIRPVAINYDIEQQKETIKILYKWHGQNLTFDCLPSNLNNINYIRKLVDRGIDIVVEHASLVQDYLLKTLRDNRGTGIPEIRTTDKLGWAVTDGHIDFVPFSSLLVYSGEHVSNSFASTFEASAGTLDQWKELMNSFRDKDHIHARIILAASFASVLVKPLGALPFAVDIWGGGSGSGKSVSLMTATSVWAKPGIDDGYIRKCDSTLRSLESDAATLNNLPLCIDETQTVKDKRGFDVFVYNLCSGVSHGAMTNGARKREEKSWSNCTILTGEQPIASANSLAGATNRIIDLECPNTLFWRDTTRFPEYCKGLRENYGTAGRAFIDQLCISNRLEYVKEVFEGILNDLQGRATGKQSASAALILTADRLADEWIFKDGIQLTADDILPFLKDEAAVDTNARVHRMILEWIATNSGKFKDGKDSQWGRYGMRDGRATCEIVRKTFNDFLEHNGFNDRSYLSWAKNEGKIYYKADDSNSRSDIQERFNGERVRFVCIYLDEDE